MGTRELSARISARRVTRLACLIAIACLVCLGSAGCSAGGGPMDADDDAAAPGDGQGTGTPTAGADSPNGATGTGAAGTGDEQPGDTAEATGMVEGEAPETGAGGVGAQQRPSDAAGSDAAPCAHPPIRFAIRLDAGAPICVHADFFSLNRPGTYALLCEGDQPCRGELPNGAGLQPLPDKGVSAQWQGLVRIDDPICTDGPGGCVPNEVVLCGVDDPAIGVNVAPIDRVVFWAWPWADGACTDTQAMPLSVPFDPQRDSTVVVGSSEFGF